MKKTNYLLLSMAVLTVGWLLAAISVKADPLFPPASSAPPRSCDLGTAVSIVAGSNGNPAAPFPRVVNCPASLANPDCPTGFSGSGQFLLWEYTFTYHGVNPSNAFLSVSDDTELFFATPTAAVSTPICAGDSQSKAGQSTCETRFLRFNAYNSTFSAAYLTSPNWAPRIATAGAKAGNFQQYCLLAGAGKPTEATGNAVTHVESQTPACDYEFEVSPGGHSIVTGTLKTIPPGNPDCPIEEDNVPPTLNGMVVSGFETDIDHPIRTEGSCNYTYTNTSGGTSTITCSTCCISKSTNKCVLKSSLTSPTTQCTSGSL
jgi:hypothetical protein